MPGSLSENEYRNPVLVFRKAFKKFTIRDFDVFLAEIVYFSLGNFHNVPEKNIISPFLHLNKMLDAAPLILEMRNQKKQSSCRCNNCADLLNPYHDQCGNKRGDHNKTAQRQEFPCTDGIAVPS